MSYGNLFRAQEAAYVLRKFISCSGSRVCPTEIYFVLRKPLMSYGNLFRAQEAAYVLQKFISCSGSRVCPTEIYFVLKKLRMSYGNSFRNSGSVSRELDPIPSL
jgi:hypothetical protein